jgi:hypothetical protein
MRWFRDNVRHGSWLALLALAINLGLSFGHFHAADGKHTGTGSLIGAASSDADRTHGHPGDTQGDCLCPICTAISAMTNALTSEPPMLKVEFAGLSLDRPTESLLAFVERSTAAFQSRGPPLS